MNPRSRPSADRVTLRYHPTESGNKSLVICAQRTCAAAAPTAAITGLILVNLPLIGLAALLVALAIILGRHARAL